jgi:multiple sugar transport system permease protein
MALIPVVGRKSLKARLGLGLIYLVLTLGAVTMVYPFLLMLGGSITSQYDLDKHAIIPAYLTSDRALFGKYAEDKYGGDFSKIGAAYGSSYTKYDSILPPNAVDAARVADWNEFVKDLPQGYKQAGFAGSTAAFAPSRLLDRYRDFLRRRFHDDINALDREYTQEDVSFLGLYPPFEQPAKRAWAPDSSAKTRDWVAFEATLPPSFYMVVLGDPLYRKWLKEEAYPDLASLNTAWGTSYADYSTITLPARPIGNAARQADWATYVRTKMPFRYVRVADSATTAYQSFLKTRYKGNIKDYEEKHAATVASFADIKLPDIQQIPPAGPPQIDWLDFLKTAPPDALTADTVETRYRAFAMQKYGIAPDAAATLLPPIAQTDWSYVQQHGGELRRNFLGRNYALVLQYIALHGRAAQVTFIYCLLAVLTALIVNPLCAYALSRFNLSYTNTVLLFLLSTMAFPAEVAMIPNFLLLKQLGLLNTFAALILPSAASGYSIFLMKGFFDSLPKELYEAGMIDGASEVRMFRSITLPLAMPIFAYIAYHAFVLAYGAFLFALITCQDPKMWTLTVWLYELQASGAPEYVVLAGSTLIAIPTMIAFICAQRVIMRGIILPSFK